MSKSLDSVFGMGIYALTICIIFSLASDVMASVKGSGGLDFGGNASLLSGGAWGMGAGLQYSVFGSLWTDKPMGGKFRIESISSNQEAIGKSSTEDLVSGTYLKSTSQKWTTLSVGVQGNFIRQGQSFFWEALVGYASAGSGQRVLTQAQVDTSFIENNDAPNSGFILSGGIGMQKSFAKYISGVLSLRTMILTTKTYGDGKAYYVLPAILSFGVVAPFEF